MSFSVAIILAACVPGRPPAANPMRLSLSQSLAAFAGCRFWPIALICHCRRLRPPPSSHPRPHPRAAHSRKCVGVSVFHASQCDHFSSYAITCGPQAFSLCFINNISDVWIGSHACNSFSAINLHNLEIFISLANCLEYISIYYTIHRAHTRARHSHSHPHIQYVRHTMQLIF